MLKTLSGARLVVAYRNSSTKALSKAVAKAFTMILKQIQTFHEKSNFYSNYKKSWVAENFKPVKDRLDQRNTKQNARIISAIHFSTLYTKLPQKYLLKVLFDFIDFGFNGGSKKKIDFSLKNAFWLSKPKSKSFFTKTSLKRTKQFLIDNQYFSVDSVVLTSNCWNSFGDSPCSIFD